MDILLVKTNLTETRRIKGEGIFQPYSKLNPSFPPVFKYPVFAKCRLYVRYGFWFFPDIVSFSQQPCEIWLVSSLHLRKWFHSSVTVWNSTASKWWSWNHLASEEIISLHHFCSSVISFWGTMCSILQRWFNLSNRPVRWVSVFQFYK